MPFFQTVFSDDHLYTIAEFLEPRTFKKGEVLIKEEEPQDRAFIIVSGKVVQTVKGSGYDKKKENDLLGLNHLFLKDATFATSTAKEETRCLILSYDKLQELLKKPEITTHFLSALALSLRQSNKAVNQLKGTSGFNVAFYDCSQFS